MSRKTETKPVLVMEEGVTFRCDMCGGEEEFVPLAVEGQVPKGWTQVGDIADVGPKCRNLLTDLIKLTREDAR